MINGRNLSDQPVKNNLRTYDNIRMIATAQGGDYTTDYLLDYPYFKNYNKMTAIDLSQRQALDADLKAIQQTNFTANLSREENTTPSFIIEETTLDFSQEIVKIL